MRVTSPVGPQRPQVSLGSIFDIKRQLDKYIQTDSNKEGSGKIRLEKMSGRTMDYKITLNILNKPSLFLSIDSNNKQYEIADCYNLPPNQNYIKLAKQAIEEILTSSRNDMVVTQTIPASIFSQPVFPAPPVTSIQNEEKPVLDR